MQIVMVEPGKAAYAMEWWSRARRPMPWSWDTA